MRTITEIGGLVQQRRTELGYTQARLASMANVSRDWIISIENGRRLTVDLDRLMRTLDVLGLAIEITKTDEGEPTDADRAVSKVLEGVNSTGWARLRDGEADGDS
jgi:transcriptional regulator with XRE-family HTH domain